MKKLLLLLAPLTLGLMVGCSYDDSAILDKITELEKEQDEMQAQIDAQQALLDALANNLTITAVTQNDNGYTITFSDGSSMTIKNGEQGEKGDKGDNGENGEKGDKGEQGDSFIESIVVGEEDVTFTLADGTVIVIPLGSDSGDTSSEDNKIYYTTSDNTKLFPKTDASLYGAILISNTYKDGQGILVFDDAVTSIGSSAFSGCTSLTSVTMGNGVTSIGYEAFRGCTSLTSVTIPDSVTSIWGYAFSGCSSLTSITIPDSVTSIGESAFSGCSSLTSITIPDSVTSIGQSAFYNCTSLTSITIPDSVTSIGGGAFSGCSSLTSATIGNGVTSIGNYAFSGCTSLTSVTIGNGVTSIGGYAFENCSSLTSITIPESITSIGGSAFSGCTSLTDTYVNITDLAAYATGNITSKFPGAKHLMIDDTEITELVIPDGVTSIGEDAFRNCKSLTSISIPESVTSIGGNAFAGCSGLPIIDNIRYADSFAIEIVDKTLSAYTLKEGTKYIGNSAFSYCKKLTSITIPDSVTSIGEDAFYNCESLKEVYCKPTTPPSLGGDIFNYNAHRIKIYVPTESVNAYKTAYYGRNFASNIVGYDF